MNFSSREVRDLLVAWLALGLAFSLLYVPVSVTTITDVLASAAFLEEFALSLATVGVAFLLHELAHKVVAVRFGQHAEFRADFGMLALAVAGGLAGFLFAAPGAVHHRGRITPREHGLIALAGPLTNVALAILSLGVFVIAPDIGWRGLFINVLLAGFNMIPFGPLDGATVLQWNKAVYAAAAVITIGPALVLFLGI
ncbi:MULTISPECIES: metalloprotease [unclassified Halobacterium]|uniref:metalloprotease n=1 Tax=unclassified Halobacterium TaxID=2668073 RepID=UPI001E557C19|nr:MULTISPECIES: metalloprotease [unclassified Halobacterium]MCD2199135.1 metalloprotease [Halobacterium sp. KA-4]MCD2202566.1 metalloprotease [Halobacterium sp. KA-6]